MYAICREMTAGLGPGAKEVKRGQVRRGRFWSTPRRTLLEPPSRNALAMDMSDAAKSSRPSRRKGQQPAIISKTGPAYASQPQRSPLLPSGGNADGPAPADNCATRAWSSPSRCHELHDIAQDAGEREQHHDSAPTTPDITRMLPSSVRVTAKLATGAQFHPRCVPRLCRRAAHRK